MLDDDSAASRVLDGAPRDNAPAEGTQVLFSNRGKQPQSQLVGTALTVRQFVSEELANPSGIAQQVSAAQDSVSSYLWPRFYRQSREVIGSSASGSAPLVAPLLLELNRVVNVAKERTFDDFYSPERFTKVARDRMTLTLANYRPRDRHLLQGARSHLHRLLLR